jgi:hypothetical protein
MKVENATQLAKLLKADGFDVHHTHDVSFGDEYNCYNVLGRNVRGAFADPNNSSYLALNGRIALDNSGCFDKFQKCPLVKQFPFEYEDLVSHISFLGSKEGFEWSNSYAYINDAKLPREV